MDKKKIVIIAGPTAVGKTGLSIKLAKEIDGEIISADSMQVYKGMDIGSAKIMPGEMDGIKHYLIDCLSPKEDFNVYVFKRLAENALSEIYSHGKIPIIVGGTGFYIQALLYDIDFKEEDNTEIRRKLTDISYSENGPLLLYEKLKSLDPDYANTLHMNNVKKVIRALEYIELNGELFSVHNAKERSKESPYDFSYFVLNDDREKLYANIEKRVDIMINSGLLDEVKALKEMGLTKDYVSMQGLGYKEILDYLDGFYTLPEAVDKIKLETRHFAKRQLTYFRRERDINWIMKPDFDYDDNHIIEYMKEIIYKNGC